MANTKLKDTLFNIKCNKDALTLTITKKGEKAIKKANRNIIKLLKHIDNTAKWSPQLANIIISKINCLSLEEINENTTI